MSLQHRIPQCAGRWESHSRNGKLEWVCSECGAVGDDRLENHLQAIREMMIRKEDDELAEEQRKKFLDNEGRY